MSVPKIHMKSLVLVVTDIKKRTTAFWLQDIKIGDRIMFVQTLEGPGSTSRGGSRAAYVFSHNLTQNTKRGWSLNMVDRIFDVIDVNKE